MWKTTSPCGRRLLHVEHNLAMWKQLLHVEYDFSIWKTTSPYGRQLLHLEDNLSMWKMTFPCERWPLHVKDDLFFWKTTSPYSLVWSGDVTRNAYAVPKLSKGDRKSCQFLPKQCPSHPQVIPKLSPGSAQDVPKSSLVMPSRTHEASMKPAHWVQWLPLYSFIAYI